MTPKQAERLRKKIIDIKRVLAAEKKKFGAYDDSRGLRYFPTRYYIQLGDFKGGLTYLRWFAKNFPDDAGFPDFLFEWTIILYQSGKTKEAEKKAIETFCADIHLFDEFLDRPGIPVEPWEYAAIEDDSFAAYFDSLGKQTMLVDFAEWLTAFMATERFLTSSSKYIDLNRQLHGEHDVEKRRPLVRQLGQIAHSID
ncbi:MAG: hypothetical protein EOO61_05565 [Hymenobacter sp.]|nr:MAG: hypothetical protein EOO61_05565 [Hymenobacter sp.]